MTRMPRPSRIHLWTVAAVLLCGSAGAGADPLTIGPLDLSAFVQDSLQPGGTVFEESKPLVGTLPSPLQSADLLHLLSRGSNFSGHSPQIAQPFASSLAESDGNGGVGVTNWLAGNPGNAGVDAVGQLVAQSLWTQTFLYSGSSAAEFSLDLKIPKLDVALIGVAPNRDSASSTETARASARLDSLITHADGSFTHGASFEFGARVFETQLPGDPGPLLNFEEVDFINVNADPTLFRPIPIDGGSVLGGVLLDSVSTSVHLGTLQPGDILSYVYTLTATGTTHGGEHGYFAFIGDPFGVETVSGNLVPRLGVAAAVPEPGIAALLAVGFGWCAWRRRAGRRR